MSEQRFEPSSETLELMEESFSTLVFEALNSGMPIDRATSEATKRMIIYCVEESCLLQESWGKKE